VALGHCPRGEFRTFTPFQPCWIGDASFSHDGVGTGFIPALTPIRDFGGHPWLPSYRQWMVKRDSFDRFILAVIFRIGAHARGVLWYGVKEDL
jgi:hypothetical protein